MTTFSPPTRHLALFLLVSALGVHVALAAFGERGALHETGLLLRGEQGGDSWVPMLLAYVTPSDPTHPLYQNLFFERRVKFVYPPTTLLLFRALELTLPQRAWKAALDILSWLCVAIAIASSAALLDRGLARASPPASSADRVARLALAVACGLVFYPLIKACTLGQMQVVVNAAFAACLLCWQSGRRATAGVLVALMAVIKPQYGLFVLWGFVRREWRFAASAALAGLALLGLSVACFGVADHVDYLRVVAYVGRHGEAYWPNQSLNGFLQRLFDNGQSRIWDPVAYPPFHPLVYAGTLVGSLLLLGAGLFWAPRIRPRADAVDLAGFAVALTLASPLAWEHHYGVLLPILAVALVATLERPVRGRASLALLAVCGLIASNYFEALGRLSGTVWNPLQSLLFGAAIALLALLLGLRRAYNAPRIGNQIVR